ncbi:type VI secretion system tip protein TssI/VgrG [Lentisphaerota bacterium ZTH]|nr:type VI secretion system tip protein VgrG [Lentisphaerota bacterium]WET06204.1 type VI secretion system tip protein TssI/VgrG [Lentisphaerota bacterium ZTH]
MSVYTQQNRNLQLEVEGKTGEDAAGNDQVLIDSIAEGSFIELSRPFELYLNLISPATSPVLTEKEMLGRNATVKLKLDNNEWRYLNGIIETFQLTGYYNYRDSAGVRKTNTELYAYRALLCPKMKLLDNTRRNRIFHDKKPQEIVHTVLNEWQIDHEFRLEGNSSNGDKFFKIEQSVEYSESDLNYLSRLLQKEGIYYYFIHQPREDAKGLYTHKMIMQNTNPAEAVPLQYDIQEGVNSIYRFEKGEKVTSRLLRLNDYDYRQADTNFFDNDDGDTSQETQLGDYGLNMLIDNPVGGFVNLSDKNQDGAYREKLKKVAVQRAKGTAYRWTGATHNSSIDAGMAFELQNFPGESVRGLITRVDFKARTTPYATGTHTVTDDKNFSFDSSFSAIALDCVFRPELTAEQPQINSITAGKVITVDSFPNDVSSFSEKLGGDVAWLQPATFRVKLLMLWENTRGSEKKPDYGSMWMYARFSQMWADPHSGRFEIPRKGQEVLVAFNNGSPEAPIIVGSVYNSSVTPPVDVEQARNLYSSFLRTGAVDKEGALQNDNPLAVDIAKPLSVYDLGTQSNQKHFSQIAFMNMDNGKFTEPRIDNGRYLTKFFFPDAQGGLFSAIDEGQRLAQKGSDSGKMSFEGINMYSNKDVLNQAAQSQYINAGKDVQICAGGSLTLQVGRCKMVIKDDGIALSSMLSDPDKTCGYVEDYRGSDSSAPEKPKAQIPSFSSFITMFPGYSGMSAPYVEVLGAYRCNMKTWFGAQTSGTLGSLGVRGLKTTVTGGSSLLFVFSDIQYIIEKMLQIISADVPEDGSIAPKAASAGAGIIDSMMMIYFVFTSIYGVITSLKAIFGLRSSCVSLSHDAMDLSSTKITSEAIQTKKGGNPLGPLIGSVRDAGSQTIPGVGDAVADVMTMANLSEVEMTPVNQSTRTPVKSSTQASDSDTGLSSSEQNVSKSKLAATESKTDAVGTDTDLSANKTAVVGAKTSVSENETAAAKTDTKGVGTETGGAEVFTNGIKTTSAGLDAEI